MELKQLRYFLVLAEELHFGRAAERLHVEKPALSRGIQELESELGSPLLDRSEGNLTLTENGRSVLDGARRLLGEPVLPIPAPVAGESKGAGLRVGQLTSATSRVISRVVSSFRERYPDQPLHLSTGSSPEHIAGVRSRQCDVAFVRLPMDCGDDLAQLVIEEEPLRVAVEPTNPLAAQPTVHPRDLVQQPLVFFPRDLNPALHDDVLSRLAEIAGAAPHVISEAPTLESVLSSAAICHAATLVTTSQSSDAPRYGLSVRQLVPGLGVRLGLVWRRAEPPAVLQNFINLAQTLSPYEPLRAMLRAAAGRPLFSH